MRAKGQRMTDRRQVHIYLWLAALTVVLMAIVNPPNQVPDELAHFIRAYDVSKGHLLANRSVNLVPQAFTDLLTRKVAYSTSDQIQLLKQAYDPTAGEELSTAATYPFASYVPQGLGIALGRLLRFSPLAIFLLGRVLNGLAFIAILSVSLRFFYFKKWLLLFLFCSPMAIFEAASYSADSVTNGVGFLFLSLVFSYSQSEEPFSKKQWGAAFLLSWSLALCKANIAPLVLLLAVIPSKRFGSLVKKVLFIVVSTGLVLATMWVWSPIVFYLGLAAEFRE